MRAELQGLAQAVISHDAPLDVGDTGARSSSSGMSWAADLLSANFDERMRRSGHSSTWVHDPPFLSSSAHPHIMSFTGSPYSSSDDAAPKLSSCSGDQ